MTVKNHYFAKRCAFCNKRSHHYTKIDNQIVCSDECAEKMAELKERAPYAGMHLVTSRGIYAHHGIGDLEGNIIHYSGVQKSREEGIICKTSMKRFTAMKGFEIISHPLRKFSILMSVRRAESRLGEKVYDLPANNCEHFVFWAIEGKHMSMQVEKIIKIVAVLCFLIMLALSLQLFALSGSTGLASDMPVVSWLGKVEYGSGLITSLTTIGFCGALIIAIGLHISVYRSSPGMPSKDTKYKRIGKYSAYISAFVFTLAGMLLMRWRAENLIGFKPEWFAGARVVRYVFVSLLYGAAMPAVLTAITGYGVYKLCWFYNRYIELKHFDSKAHHGGNHK